MEEYFNKSLSNKWIESNKPTTINDLIGNNYQINIIKNWLINYYKFEDLKKNSKLISKDIENYSSCIVNGNHGIGKTSFVTTILTSLKYKIFTINFRKINNAKNIKELVITDFPS